MMIDPILFRFSRLAARKTVWENLIKDLIGHPLRAAIRQIDGELLQPRRRKTVKALRREPALTIRPQQLKTVAPTRLAAGKIDFAPPRHDARMRLLAQSVHRQRELFIIFFRTQRHPLRQIVAAEP